jgi:tetratricopeptide (TPR) repeat protein
VWRFGMKKVFSIGLLILLFGILSVGEDHTHTGYWIKTFGDYSREEGKNDPRVKWANHVFERVKRHADKNGKKEPHLSIIKSKGANYAFALPDGGVIINVTTLDICYGEKDFDSDLGNRRIAFILGHELAHLAYEHVLHEEMFRVMKKLNAPIPKTSRGKNGKDGSIDEQRVHFRPKELLADKMGAFYASMAGYNMGKLVAVSDNFFQHWAAKTNVSMTDDSEIKHPPLQQRLKSIRTQFREIAKHLELFNAAVLLFQMKSYLEAAKAFEDFLTIYPAREVYNNIGACYFNLAMMRIYSDYSDDYFRFKLVTYISYKTTAQEMISRGDGRYLEDEKIAHYIDRAIYFYRKAVEKNPSHIPSNTNLAAALILNREYAGAISVCESILKVQPGNIDALNNQAIAHHYYGINKNISRGEGENKQMIMTQKAIGDLKKTLALNPENLDTIYNLAALYQLNGQMDDARALWKKFLSKYSIYQALPRDNYYGHIYKKMYNREWEPANKANNIGIPRCGDSKYLGRYKPNIESTFRNSIILPYKLGREKDKRKRRWYSELHVVIKKDFKIIALDKVIEVIERNVEEGHRLRTNKMLHQLGAPLRTVKCPGGCFYIYNGFSFKEIDGNVASHIWFEKE